MAHADSSKLRVTLGADPEVFIQDLTTGEIVPVCGWLGGTKRKPVSMDATGRYKVQEDGIAAEYNISPCADALVFAKAISAAQTMLSTRIMATNPNYGIVYAPYVVMRRSELSKYHEAYVFGCSPEFDAYSEGAPAPRVIPEQLVLPQDANVSDCREYRFAGGHIHIGMSVRGVYALPIPKYVLAAMCDASIGLSYLINDQQGARRAMYGQAGRFRPTKYGIEYRVLSNFWTATPDMTYSVAYSLFSTLRLLANTDQRAIQTMFDAIPWGAVREAINTEDGSTAREIYSYIWDDVYREVA